MDSHIKLLLNNQLWAKEKLEEDQDYFKNMAKEQRPEYLWIGCSDSRVPANEVIGAEPGDLFVHRNIANMVVHTDMNLLSVLQFAVDVLEVKHVIVCGHYGCGGVKAALSHQDLGVINSWLRNIKDVYRLHESELLSLENQESRLSRLVELNVEEQVLNLAKSDIIQRAWSKHNRPYLHGWVYGLDNGIIKQVFEMPPNTEVESIYKYRQG